jgi:hypothetical protein
MVKTVATRAKDAVTDAAQRSARGVKSIAGDAFGAAAKAAADVVLESTVHALEFGRTRLRRASPAMKQAIGKAAKRRASKKKTVAKRKPSRSKQRPTRRSR